MGCSGNEIKIHTWNANGVLNKQQELGSYLVENKVDIMLINELKVKDNFKLTIRNYTTIFKLRDNNTGYGGVAILIKKGIPFIEVDSVQCSIENIGIKIEKDLTIIAAYNPPSNKYKSTCLDALLNGSGSTKVIVMGDLNSKHFYWNCEHNNRNGNTLLDYVTDRTNCNILHTDEHTHYPENNMRPSTIDLVLTKNVHLHLQIETLHALSSDHNPVVLTIPRQTSQPPPQTIYTYHNCDWAKYRTILNNNVTLQQEIRNPDELERAVETLTKHIHNAKKRIATKLTISGKRKELPAEIRQLIGLRNRHKKAWQKWGNIADKTTMQALNRDIRTRLRTYSNEQWTGKLQKLNIQDKSLWKISKALRKGYKELPTLQDNQQYYVTDEEKATKIATYFEINHQLERDNTQEQKDMIKEVEFFLSKTHLIPSSILAKQLTTPNEIKTILKTLPNDKAPGHDDIDYKLLKNAPQKVIIQLLYLVNAIIRLQHWPSNWKQAIVIPIPKPGKNPKLITSYRPISLLSTISKLVEKIILIRFKRQIKKLKLENPNQFGFTDRLGTTHQLARVTTDIINNFNKNKNTVMALIDMEKAFDKVWVIGVVYKLIKAGFPEHLTVLIYSYLSNRKMRIRINTTFSPITNIVAGVPQGSVLGPHIFNFYMAKIPEFPNSKLALFADDTAVYAHSFYAQASSYLVQQHLAEIVKYTKTWKIQMNQSKTELITFTRKFTNNKLITPVKLDNHIIKPQQSVKYLGVELDYRLNYQLHVKQTLKKAYNAGRLLYPLMCPKSNLSNKNKKLLYKVIIRPIISYAAPVWSGISPSEFRPLESYQNKMLRLITNSNRYTKINDMLEQAGMEPLRDFTRRLSERFYATTLKINKETKNITKTRIHNNLNPKHRLPYQHLPIYELPQQQ